MQVKGLHFCHVWQVELDYARGLHKPLRDLAIRSGTILLLRSYYCSLLLLFSATFLLLLFVAT